MIDSCYVNHVGRKVDLSDGVCNIKPSALADWSIGARSLNGRLASFFREQKSFGFDMVIASRSEAEAIVRRNEVYEASIVDVEAMKPGRLYIDGWYLEGYIVESEKDSYWYSGMCANYTLSFLADDPRWTFEHKTEFVTEENSGTGSGYPRNYPRNYGASRGVMTLSNPGVVPSPVRITAYGPAARVLVNIGDNRYEVGAPLASGEIMVIDGQSKRIYKISEYGAVTNLFQYRRGLQKKGSGAYVFEPVAPGEHGVSCDGSFGFDVTLFEKRDERRWT